MRTLDDILSDVCKAFDSTIEVFKNRSPKRINEHMSLINQAFIAIALYNMCVNASYLGHYLKRTAGSIITAHNKAKMLLESSNPYALNFKERIKQSCEEGRKLIEFYEKN